MGEYAQSSSAVLFLRSFKTLGHCSQQVVAVYSAGVLKGLFQSHFPFRQVPSLANRTLLRNGFCHNALSLRIEHRRRDFCNGLVSPVPSFLSQWPGHQPALWNIWQVPGRFQKARNGSSHSFCGLFLEALFKQTYCLSHALCLSLHPPLRFQL